MGKSKKVNSELEVKSKELIDVLVKKFGLDARAINAAVFKVLASVHVTPDTEVTEMRTDLQSFLGLVNQQAVVQMKEDQVKVTGIDIGNHSIAQILALPHGGFSGTVTVNYVNVLNPPLTKWLPETTKVNKARRQTNEHVIKQIDTLLSILDKRVVNTLTGAVK